MKIAVLAYFFALLVFTTVARGGSYYNLLEFGAKPGGGADSSAALRKAWAAACSSASSATIHVPSGKFLVASPTVFHGGRACKSNSVNFVIDGTLVASSDYTVLASNAAWLSFEGVVGVSITGGVLDGQGSGLWACKNGSGDKCPKGATTLVFTNSKNIAINGLKSLNSQLYHIVFNGCKNVMVQSIVVSASGQSPNTDGIHVQSSTGVVIRDTKIATGDDCVSVGQDTSNLLIENVACGPGHGISIGSLGKKINEGGVQNVTVKGVSFTGTQNGVRIKSWARPSTGFVRNVLFQHATMINVQNPIIIDQKYCPHQRNCPTKVSGVKINDVTYEDIHGSSATQVAVKFDCSATHPCTGIKLKNVRLTYNNGGARASCANAEGSAYGVNEPSSCLTIPRSQVN